MVIGAQRFDKVGIVLKGAEPDESQLALDNPSTERTSLAWLDRPQRFVARMGAVESELRPVSTWRAGNVAGIIAPV